MNRLIRQGLATGTGMALAALFGGAAALAQNQSAGTSGAAAQPQHTIQMVPVQAELAKTIDAKKAKQGDPVTAKVVQDVKIPDAQDLPKNSVLEGHVDQVQASDHKSDSTVVVTFDKVRLKGGQELPVKATVVAIAEPVMAQQQQQQAAGGGVPAGGGAPMAGGGGAAPSSGGGEAGGGGANSAPTPMPSAQPTEMPSPSGGTQQQAQANGVPGVTLTSSIHQQSSATFTSKGKNVHVPDGTQMEVAVAVIPPGVKLQQ